MSIYINVDAAMFAAASICASNEEVRSYLCGVHIRSHPVKGALLIATDGHRLIVIHDGEGKCNKPSTITIPEDGIAHCKRGRGVTDPPRLTIFGDGIATIGEWRSPSKCFVPGSYPDWWKVIPLQKWSNEPASFNGRYVGDFGKAANILYGREFQPVCVFTSGVMDPALVLFPNAPHAFGILMPMRADVCAGIPLWMKPLLDKLKAKESPRKARAATPRKKRAA